MKTTCQNYTIHIESNRDDDMGPPWKEHDGHGIVSEWVSRDKHAGEWLLCSDRSSRRYYDFAETIQLATKDGWGLGEAHLAEFTAKLGRKPTRKQIIAESVRRDFEYLRGWCNDQWQWLWYRTTITTPDGTKLNDRDSCGGFDDEKYMMEEAMSNARHTIDRHIEAQAKEAQEAFTVACADIATI